MWRKIRNDVKNMDGEQAAGEGRIGHDAIAIIMQGSCATLLRRLMLVEARKRRERREPADPWEGKARWESETPARAHSHDELPSVFASGASISSSSSRGARKY
jgi:hypothetical protein